MPATEWWVRRIRWRCRSGSMCSRPAVPQSMRPLPPTPPSVSWSRYRAASVATSLPWCGTPTGEKLYGLNASGRAPAALTIDMVPATTRGTIPVYSPYSWTVPGCADGWFELHERFGRLPMKDVLGPVAAMAREGAPVPQVIAGSWARGARRIRGYARLCRRLHARRQDAGRRRHLRQPRPCRHSRSSRRRRSGRVLQRRDRERDRRFL